MYLIYFFFCIYFANRACHHLTFKHWIIFLIVNWGGTWAVTVVLTFRYTVLSTTFLFPCVDDTIVISCGSLLLLWGLAMISYVGIIVSLSHPHVLPASSCNFICFPWTFPRMSADQQVICYFVLFGKIASTCP